MNSARLTWVLAVLTMAVFLLATPGALGHTRESGGIYLFSWRFLADIPARLMGPGWFRFILQPIMAGTLGTRDGRAAPRASGASHISMWALANLVLVAILLDVVFQWVILGTAHPGAALVVGPVLITCPYLLSRALAKRAARQA